ncbi:hypothetical protein QJS04_geneDACA018154 [Acorus gramineus]|uniref:Prolamin-like domain-containing protein n=1 Tax=Acorus gramineus TaxID=55184 RepID=A0AAV9ALB8_ACOGR|nr:hypothetical protein QJS04_geneDACA018154 [Acorus gramineus]
MRNAGSISAATLMMVVVFACVASPSLARLVVEENKTVVDDIEKCWAAVIGASGCIQDVFSSFFTGRISLGPQCCVAIEGISDNCFSKIFPFLGASFNPLLKAFCIAQSGTAPPPTA